MKTIFSKLKKPSIRLINSLLVVCGVFLMISTGYRLKAFSQNISKNKETNNSKATGVCQDKYMPISTFKFEYEPKNFILDKANPIFNIALREGDYMQSQVPDGEILKTFDITSDGTKAVLATYIENKLQRVTQDYVQIERVYLINTLTGDRRRIFEHKMRPKDQYGDYLDQIDSVKFRSDGNVVISLSNKILLYNTANNQISSLFSLEETSRIYGLYDPTFNRSNSRFLISFQYYEGSDSAVIPTGSSVYQLVTQNRGYEEDSRFMGWFKDRVLTLKTKYGQNPDDTPMQTFFLISPESLDEEELFTTMLDHNEIVKYIDEKVFFTHNIELDSVQNVCGKAIRPSLQTLYMYDIASKKTTKLLEIDSTKSSDEGYFDSKILDFDIYETNGKKELLLKLDKPDYARTMYESSEPFRMFYNSFSDHKIITRLFTIDLETPNVLQFVKYTYKETEE